MEKQKVFKTSTFKTKFKNINVFKRHSLILCNITKILKFRNLIMTVQRTIYYCDFTRGMQTRSSNAHVYAV